jgi:dynein heavy chain 2
MHIYTYIGWITNMEPFILVGPEGCGKSMIINHAFKQRRNVGIATLHCNAQVKCIYICVYVCIYMFKYI